MKSKSNKPLWVLIVVSSLATLAAADVIVWEAAIVPMQTDNTMDEIRTVATGTEEATDSTSKPDKAVKKKKTSAIDFSSLRAVNKDIIGWIQVPGTVIDYPVLQSSTEEPQHYLYRDYKGNDTKYGSIFMDADATIGKSRCMTLYGHHMNDGRMFADILKYGDLAFYQSSPTFTFDTYKSAGTWKVISVFKANVNPDQGEPFAYVRTDFGSDEDFLTFVHQVMIRSLIDTGVTVNEKDKLLVLSTCSYEYDNFRTVVVARKVRKGESVKVDTKNAVYRSSPLYPDCWYGDSEKPQYPETFQAAQKQHMTEWYDGKLLD